MIIVFGIWCFVFPLRRHPPSAVVFAWIWVVVEVVNGVGHPLWSIRTGSYTPGVATAPVLLVLALYVARALREDARRVSAVV